MTSTLLTSQRIVVFGATGNVGGGVASAALAAGATVILPARSASSAAALRTRYAGQKAHVVLGDVSEGREADDLARRIGAEHGPIRHVVASIGAWWSGGPLVDQAAAEWDDVRRMLLDSHVHAARTLLPLLDGPQASYVIITGAGAVRPRSATSLLSIALGGTLALSRLLRDEYRRGPRVNEVRIQARVETQPRPGVVPARAFGDALLPLLTADVRGAVIPFVDAETFDIHAHLHEDLS